MLLGEVLKLADHCLPISTSGGLQTLPDLFSNAVAERELDDGEGSSSALIYQIDRVSRTIQRSSASSKSQPASAPLKSTNKQIDPQNRSTTESGKTRMSVDMDELKFRSIILETQVLSSPNYMKWRWDLILDLIEGPLTNLKRLEESIKTSKFMKRLIGFYRPFKYKFSDVRNTKPNQRYVRAGCALMKTLLLHQEGVNHLLESKFLRQLAECLAQLDKQSGLTVMKPFLTKERTADTLTGGYFAMLGTLTGDPRGLSILGRWRMINMMYHIVELDSREDLVKLLLSTLNFSSDNHTRVMLSKALTACPKNIRIYATRLLRKYATVSSADLHPDARTSEGCEWAIRLLVTQLYDPEVQVSEVAVQILEEVCNNTAQLEYVVRCRPALDHLGAIGAPLLLRYVPLTHGGKL